MQTLTGLRYLLVFCGRLSVVLFLAAHAQGALAQESAPSSARLAPESNVRPFVGAVNGVAFTLQKKGQGVAAVPVPTSLPAFKAFGLSRDQQRLLYTPLKNGAPSGELCIEDISTSTVTWLPPHVILQAAWSPADDNRIAYSFGGVDAYGIAVLQLDTGRATVLAQGKLLPESFRWDASGNGIHYLEATGDAGAPGVLPRYVSIGAPGPARQVVPPPPADFPVLKQPVGAPASGQGAPVLALPDNSATPAAADGYAFRVRSPKGRHEILGENVTGNGRLFLVDSGGTPVSIGEGQLVGVLEEGVVVRRFSTAGTSLEYVSWGGTTVDLATTVLTYNLPMANPTVVQGGQGYASPGNCSVGSHVNAMAFAYDLWNSSVGAHVLAAADGLVVYTTSSVTCNTVDTNCPDYAAGGCSATFFGNIIILQHSDGTFTKYAHMEADSVQVAPGATACQGLYVGRQGHTGSTNGSFNGCGDHLHFQRQSSPDIFGQSIPVDFADVPSNPLSCGTSYTSASVETSHSISPSSASFGIPGGSGSVSVFSTGCTWSAVSNDSWITITSGATGSGNGVVSYSVADNSTSGDRTGTLIVAGHPFVVSQTGGGVTNLAPVVDAGNDQIITLPGGAALNATATDDGLPNPPGALSPLWTAVSGPGTVTFANAQSLSTSASFSMAGIYVLRLTVSDGALSTGDNLTVTVNTNSGAGLLTGSNSTPPGTVDLTTEGSSDWAHWGTVSDTSFDHKSSGNSQISNYTRIGPISSIRYSSGNTSYSWSDGTPTASASGSATGLFLYGAGNGFQLTVPADATQRTLKLYVGVFRVRGRLEVTLSDGSASPYVNNSLASTVGVTNGVYSLTYRAASAGQNLIIRWTVETEFDPAGSVRLESAALAVNSAPGSGQLSASLATSPATLNLTAQGTLDWAHWGLTSSSSYNHKVTGGSKISNFTRIGSGALGRQQASMTRYSWSDGTPAASASNTPTGVYRIGQGSGFQLTVLADTTVRTLRLYVGVWAAQGRLEATLSDGSAPGLVDTSVINQTATSNGFYTLTYQAGTAGQSLRIRWTVHANFDPFGNVTLQAATLVTGGLNQPPLVNAGPDQLVSLPNSATVAGTASDDDLPNPPGALTTTWSLVAGPGTVTFANASALNTTATFSAAGSYTLRLTADDGALSSTDDLVVTVSAANQAPTVNAGPDQSVSLPNSATLAGTASDDGLPNPPGAFTTTWSLVAGPGTVTFANASALNTTATFSAAGSYTLRLTADDGALSSADDLVVTVNAANQAPTVNAGPDQSVTLPNSATLAGTASDDGLPNPPGAFTTTWSLVAGPGTVTFANASALNTTATFSAAGPYTLRLTADDGALSASDDVVITVNNSSNGVLSGSLATPGASVDLTAEGTLDWAHWGLVSASSFNHRAGVASQIAAFTPVGPGAVNRQKASPTSCSWTNGTPTTSASNTPAGVYKIGTGTGFQLILPADTTLRTLRLYVGLWDAQGRLQVMLSDGSAPDFVDTSLINQTATSNGVYTLNYRAASSGQTLTIRWTVQTSFNTFGNVTLQAAALQ
ncbi:MAG: peptidoglycan DD-metalloendopeptidase family protein [Acidobacteriota bacterium]